MPLPPIVIRTHRKADHPDRFEDPWADYGECVKRVSSKRRIDRHSSQDDGRNDDHHRYDG